MASNTLYANTSPWSATKITKNYLDILQIRPVAAEQDDYLYTIEPQYTYRPDLLAFDLYGTSKLWWVFSQRNLDIIQDPIFDFTPGTQIPTNPPLISGTNVEMGQSFGNEGSNVYVTEFLPENVKPSYMGCYAASPNNNNMTFIGGSPPPPSSATIQNGNFSQSQIANNSWQYLNWNTTTVPGWNFACALVNNSTAWGYPMPYPNGNQCASIQMTQQLWTTWIPFTAGVTYTLTFYACGRNCCDGSGKPNPINIGLEGKTFYTLNPTVGQWKKYSTTFTVNNSGSQRISFIGTWTAGDRSTAIQGVSLSGTSSQSGNYTYDQCKNAAIQQGYQYFALQNVNTSTSTGYCAVSNSLPSISQYGNASAPNKYVVLWTSNTTGEGSTAILSNTGSLQVLNSSGKVVYSTPSSSANPANYLGCYGDSWNRAMSSMLTGGSQQYNNSQCQQAAKQQGFQYYGLQNSTSGTTAQCFLSNNLSQTMQYGRYTNCTQISDGSWSGGG